MASEQGVGERGGRLRRRGAMATPSLYSASGGTPSRAPSPAWSRAQSVVSAAPMVYDPDRKIRLEVSTSQLKRWVRASGVATVVAENALWGATPDAAQATQSADAPFMGLGCSLLDLMGLHLENVGQHRERALGAKATLKPMRKVLAELQRHKLAGEEEHYRAMMKAIIAAEKTAYDWKNNPYLLPNPVQVNAAEGKAIAAKFAQRFDEHCKDFSSARKALMMSLVALGHLRNEDMIALVREGLLRVTEVNRLLGDKLKTVMSEGTLTMDDILIFERDGMAPSAEMMSLLQQFKGMQEEMTKMVTQRGRAVAMTPVVKHNLGEDADLVGRDRDLARVEDALRGGGKLAAIVGPSGIGKSALATAAAFAALGRAEIDTGSDTEKRRHLVWIVNAESVKALVRSYGELLRCAFEWTHEKLKNKTAQTLADALMKELSNAALASWMLVYENVPDTGYSDRDALGFDGLHPHFFSKPEDMGRAGSVLVTSHAPVFDDVRDIELKPLSDRDGAQLLLGLERWDSREYQSEREAALKLAGPQGLAGLPIALEPCRALLARRRRRRGETVHDLVRYLESAGGATMENALNLALKYVRNSDAGSRAVLDVAAYVASEGIPRQMLLRAPPFACVTLDVSALDPSAVEARIAPRSTKEIDLLVELSLLRQTAADGTSSEPVYSIHPLVQKAAQGGCTAERALEAVWNDLEPYDSDDPSTWAWALAALPHAEALRTGYLRSEDSQRAGGASLGFDDRAAVARVLHTAGLVWTTVMGKYDAALACYRTALRADRWAPGDGLKNHAAMLCNNMGVIYRRQQRYQEALKAYEEAERMSRGALGNAHPEVAAILMNEGIVYQALGLPEEALKAYKKTERIFRMSLGNGHLDVAETRHIIGNLHSSQGRDEEALEAYTAALRSRREKLGGKHLYVAKSLISTSDALIKLERYDKALPAAKEAASICRELTTGRGEVHILLGVAHTNAVKAFLGMCRPLKAFAESQEALRVFLEAGVPEEDEHLKEARKLLKKAKRGRVEKFIQWGVVAPLLVLGGLVYAPKTALSVAEKHTKKRPKKQATRRVVPAPRPVAPTPPAPPPKKEPPKVSFG